MNAGEKSVPTQKEKKALANEIHQIPSNNFFWAQYLK